MADMAYKIPDEFFLFNPKYRIPVLSALFVAYLALPAITTGCVYALLNTGVRSTNDQLVSKTTGLPVQTASADTVIQNGIMVQRNADAMKVHVGSTRSGTPVDTQIKVATIVGSIASISSAMTAEQLSSLTALEINEGRGTVHAKVQGFAIVPEGSGQYVVLQTGLGQFVLRDTNIVPAEEPTNLTGLVKAAIPNRRYLLMGGGYTNDCISNCCAYPNNQGSPYGYGCACATMPASC